MKSIVDTTFILGAGASMPYGFPSGEKLVELICTESDTRPYEGACFESTLFNQFQRELTLSSVGSIDRFLATHSEYEEIGKFAIASHLSKFEDRLELMRRFNTGYKAKSDPSSIPRTKWYNYLFDTKIDGKTVNDITNNLNRMRFITFNYDRSLEEFFWNRLKYGEQLKDDEVLRVMEFVRILHVHGSIGRLKWQAGTSFVQSYDHCTKSQHLREMSKGIKIIHEDLDETPEFLKAREWLELGERIIFLGFGYHPENLRRLGLLSNSFREMPLQGKTVWGTFYGWTKDEIEEFRYNHKWIFASDHDCLTFLRSSRAYLSDDTSVLKNLHDDVNFR